ncbi:MAG: DinB family protein [Desulfosarcinaceae bacterium]
MKDIRDLLEAMLKTPAILAAMVETIPEPKLDLRRGEGFWTIAEHVSHLAQVQPMLLERMERFIGEQHPVFVPYIPGEEEAEPETPPRMEMAVALGQFGDTRKRQTALLETVVEDQGIWRRTATHPEYEVYTLTILTRHVLMHDHWHMYRMEELWLTRDAYLTTVE